MIFLQFRHIETLDDALELLQMAIELEFSTLPPYLYALHSIMPGTNAEASSRIRFVAMEEMVHMCLACNILNALGRNPVLTAPTYPGPLSVRHQRRWTTAADRSPVSVLEGIE